VNGVDDEMWKRSVERRIDLLQKENQELKKSVENLGLENKRLKADLDLVKERCLSCVDVSKDDISDEKLQTPFIQNEETVEKDNGSEMVNRRDKKPVARISKSSIHGIIVKGFWVKRAFVPNSGPLWFKVAYSVT
jgi:hypothetical protein